MGTLAYTVPTAGTDLNAVADPELASALNTIKTWANGNIDAVNLSALLAQSVGANQNAQVVKGATNIATSQSTSSLTYTTLATPDQVTGIVLPTNGLIKVWYQATWSEAISGTARAAIFLGSNQLKIADYDGSAVPVAAAMASTANNFLPLTSCALGLQSGGTSAAYSGDVATGQLVGATSATALANAEVNGTVSHLAGPLTVAGGECSIFAGAGTYTVGVQFKVVGGTSITVKNRQLWVQALSFG